MNKKMYLIVFSIIFFALPILAQGVNKPIKLPLEIVNNHLFSKWILNDSVEARVFLESGFPKIIFDEEFILKNKEKLGIKLLPANDSTAVNFWTDGVPTKVSYLIKDTMQVNGRKVAIDALVMKYNSQGQTPRDILFPIFEVNEPIELNIKERYVQFLGNEEVIYDEYESYQISEFEAYKNFYGIDTKLQAIDKLGLTATLEAKFLLDLGAGNAFFLDTRDSRSRKFVEDAKKMRLEDSEKYNAPKFKDFSILMPESVRFGNIAIEDDRQNSIIVAGQFHSTKDNIVGVVGNQFFRHFSVIFDFQNEKLYLKPNSSNIRIYPETK